MKSVPILILVLACYIDIAIGVLTEEEKKIDRMLDRIYELRENDHYKIVKDLLEDKNNYEQFLLKMMGKDPNGGGWLITIKPRCLNQYHYDGLKFPDITDHANLSVAEKRKCACAIFYGTRDKQHRDGIAVIFGDAMHAPVDY